MKSASDAFADTREAFDDMHAHFGAPAYIACMKFVDALADYYAASMLTGSPDGVHQSRHACLAMMRVAQAMRDKNASKGYTL